MKNIRLSYRGNKVIDTNCRHYKQFLLICSVDNTHDSLAIHNFLKTVFKNQCSYWCTAEHVTYSGRYVLFLYIVFREFVSIGFVANYFDDFHIDGLDNHVPLRRYREYIMRTGMKYNLGRSHVLRGTFHEKGRG